MADWEKLNKEFDDKINSLSDEEFREWASKYRTAEGEKLVLCGYCKKPIHIDDFGGMQKDIGLFHAECHVRMTPSRQMNDKLRSIMTRLSNRKK